MECETFSTDIECGMLHERWKHKCTDTVHCALLVATLGVSFTFTRRQYDTWTYYVHIDVAFNAVDPIGISLLDAARHLLLFHSIPHSVRICLRECVHAWLCAGVAVAVAVLAHLLTYLYLYGVST